MERVREAIYNVLNEKKKKRDRCLRIADRKFKKPSAYKSGAVVRCRKGEIWKDLKEEDLNEIGEANAKPYKWKEESDYDGSVEVSFTTDNNIHYYVGLEYDEYKGKDILDVEFAAGEIDSDMEDDEYYDETENLSSSAVINKGELFRVMATIVDIVKHYVEEMEVRGVTYSASKKKGEKGNKSQRGSLYKAFLQKQVPGVKIKEKGDYIVAIFPKKTKLKEDESLRKWFDRQGAPGKEGGWVDCNTCRNGKCKPCGRKEGEKRAKYPSCRPTPAKCKTPGKGKKWGKTK